jgi:E3 ubiquitin-protein ligase NEDD4
MITSGPSVIDIQDWKNNTIYDCYEPSDQVIQWFWEIVESYDQKGFRNLLHYCTGSMRVPIMGFAKLESSHGHIKKFTIRKIDYDVDNPYPKSYTCFNRLDLPNYSSK